MQLKIDNSTLMAKAAASPAPAAVAPSTSTANAIVPSLATATATPEQTVTLTQPVTIQIPFGTTTLPRGMKLSVVSRDTNHLRVRYMDGTYVIPVLVTDTR